MAQPLPFAAPSCVIPATVADNARFLAGRVAEVGLCLFETEGCLHYGVEDVPSSLAELPLTWHVHLPMDLPWEAGGAAAAAMALAVLHKVHFLRPRLAVLHPPAGTQLVQFSLLNDFHAAWRKHSPLPVLLENIEACDLTELSPDLFAGEQAFALCLDMGHAFGFGQYQLLERHDLLEKVRLVHWSAPGLGDQHLPLTHWTHEQKEKASAVLRLLPADVTHMAEIFHWAGVEASLPLLQNLLEHSWYWWANPQRVCAPGCSR